VKCRDVDLAVVPFVTGATLPPEVADHIAGCERCRGLARAMYQFRPVTPTASDEWKAIESAIISDLKPVKPIAPVGMRFFAIALAVAVVAAVGCGLLGTTGWRALSMLQRTTVFAALATVGALLAISLVRLVAPGSKLLISPVLLAGGGFGLMAVVFTGLFHPHAEAKFVSTGLVCLRIGLECAIAAALLFWFALRRGVVLNPVLTGAAAGALAGFGGLTVLEIFCPNLNEYHVLVWHLGAAVTSALAGVVLGIIVDRSGS